MKTIGTCQRCHRPNRELADVSVDKGTHRDNERWCDPCLKMVIGNETRTRKPGTGGASGRRRDDEARAKRDRVLKPAKPSQRRQRRLRP